MVGIEVNELDDYTIESGLGWHASDEEAAQIKGGPHYRTLDLGGRWDVGAYSGFAG